MGKIIVNAGMAEIDDNKLIVNNPLSVEVGELNSPTKKSIGTREEEQIKKENSINIDELSERIGKVVGENKKVEEKEEETEKEEEKEEKVQEEKQPDAPNTPEQESNVLDGEDDMII